MGKDKIYNYFLLILCLLGSYFHYLSLSQSDYSNGWDSYFYLYQVKSLLNDGHLVSNRISTIYPLLALIKCIVYDYILSWKILNSILCLLCIFLSYKLIYEITKNKNSALISASICFCSPHLYYFSAQYTKNLMGFVLLLLLLIFLIKRKLIYSFILLIFNLITHKLTAVISIITFVLFNDNKRQKTIIKLLLFLFFILLISIPSFIGINELKRQIDFISIIPSFTLLNFFNEMELSTLWKAELILAFISCLFCIVIILYYKLYHIKYLIIPSLFILLNIPFIKWDFNGFSYRFFMFSILFSPLLYGLIFYKIKSKILTISFMFMTLFISFYGIKTYKPSVQDPDYEKFNIIVKKMKKRKLINKAKLFIVHKGFAEYIKFDTNIDAMSWIPEYQINKDSVWRITYDVPYQMIFHIVGKDDLYRLGGGYNLIKEEKWKKVINYYNDTEYNFNNTMNPYEKRPYYLLKNK